MKLLLLALFAGLAQAQICNLTNPGNTGSLGGAMCTTISASPVFPPITLGVHAATDNGAATATTVVVGPITPTAGSTMVCDVKYTTSANFTSLADNCNSGVYQIAASMLRDANHDFVVGTFYKENVGACATTITLTYTATGTHGQMACREWKGTPATYTFDSSFVAQQAATATNPNSGSTLTPFANGEVLNAVAYDDAGTTTVGACCTALLDAVSTLSPQYKIQTTATATNGAFVNASGGDYAANMTAFGPNVGGFCDFTGIIDWSGGALGDGATPTVADLNAKTKGMTPQPNADRRIGNNPPGWILAGAAAGLTYSTGAYVPLSRTRRCPFYSGSGTGTLGLNEASGNPSTGATLYFDSTQPKVSLWLCFSTDMGEAGGTKDLVQLAAVGSQLGNDDFANVQINDNFTPGGRLFALEYKGGTTVPSVTTFAQNTNYGLLLTFNQAANHTLKIYNGCGASPTLLETVTATGSISGGAPAGIMSLPSGADSFPPGINFKVGAVALDILYGGTILP